jgi:hydrogenase maturation factor HypF (carbamoyltransferase family)
MKNRERAKVAVRGAVQGVGFRPFVYHLATALGLEGWVSNSAQGVFIEVEGAHETLEKFLLQSMKKFRMCAACQKEYDDPHDRRFHAQPNACPHCGPHLELWDEQGNVLAK